MMVQLWLTTAHGLPASSRYRERLSTLLEEERSLRRNSWQYGLASLGQQQQHLLQAQVHAEQALTETDKCLFVHR